MKSSQVLRGEKHALSKTCPVSQLRGKAFEGQASKSNLTESKKCTLIRRAQGNRKVEEKRKASNMKAQTLPVGSAGFFHGVNNSPGHQGGEKRRRRGRCLSRSLTACQLPSVYPCIFLLFISPGSCKWCVTCGDVFSDDEPC